MMIQGLGKPEGSLELAELVRLVEDMVLNDDMEAGRRLQEDDVIMSSQYEIVKMKESESSLCNTDCK